MEGGRRGEGREGEEERMETKSVGERENRRVRTT